MNRQQKIDYLKTQLAKTYKVSRHTDEFLGEEYTSSVLSDVALFEQKYGITDPDYITTESNRYLDHVSELILQPAVVYKDGTSSQYELLLFFRNFSHIRPMAGLVIFFKKIKGEIMCLSESDLYHESIQSEVGTIFCNSAIFRLTEDQVNFIVFAHEVSVRFDNIEVKGLFTCDGYLFQEMKFLMTPDTASDETVNRLYDHRVLSVQLDEIHSAESKVKELNVNQFLLLKKMMKNPFSISEVQKLEDLCKKYEYKSSILEFINKIPTKYDTEDIITDVERCEKEGVERCKTAKKKRMWSFLLIMAALCLLCMFETTVLTIISIICGIVGIVMFKRSSSILKGKDVEGIEPICFNEATSRFINDFEKLV